MNKRVSQFAVAFVILIGCGVLLGCQLDIPLLKKGFLDSPYTMKPNTAVCLLLSGVSLGLLQQQRLPQWLHLVAQGCALLTGIIGLLTLGEYIFRWNLGIDELLFDNGIATATSLYPERMGEVTAFNFVLLGITLLLLTRKIPYWDWLAQSLSGVVALTATLALVGYVLGTRVLYEFVVSTTVTTPLTAVTLIVLCVGILFTHPDKGLMQTVTSSSIGGAIARRLLPWAIIVPVGINLIIIWGIEVQKHYDTLIYTLIHALEMVIVVLILSILILSSAQSIDQVEAQRQTAEQKLRESEQQFRHAVMYSPLPLMIHAEGEVLQINHVWTDITGYKPEDIPTIAKWTEQAYGERKESVREVIKGLYNLDCRVAHGEFTIRTRNGNQRIWDFYTAPLGTTPDGRRLVLSTAIDVTQRKQAEQALVQMNATLELRVRERTAELAMSNQRLQHELYERQRVAQALQESERKFRAIFEQTFQLIGLLTPDGTVLELNQRALDFIRAQREDAINRPFWELSCWSSTVEIQENLKAAIAQAAAGQFIRTELTIPNADGVMTDFDFSLKPVQDESGEVVLLIPEGREITNLKRTQSELRLVSDRLKYLLTASPAVIFSCKPNGDYGATFISENVTTILGHQPQDFLDNSDFWVNHVHPEDIEHILRDIPQIFESNYHFHQYRFLRADGKYCWLETYTKLVRDKNGNPVEFVGYLIDINKRKELEMEVAYKQQLLDSFITCAPVGMTLLDTQLRYKLVNQALAQINGIPPQEHIGKTLQEIVPDLAPRLIDICQQVLTTGQPILNVEITGETQKLPGVLRTWLLSYFPIHDQSNHSIWIGIIAAEITERRQAEEALRLQAEKEKALNRVIHTIRNSLDLPTIFNTAATETAQLLQADRVEIVQYIPSQKLWKHVAEYLQTPNLASFLEMDIPDEGNKIAEQIKKLEVVRINDTTTTMDDQINSKFAQLFPGALLLVPIQIDSTLWGSLTLGKSKQSTWQDSEVELTMTVANQLMIAIQQSELYQQLQIANQELQRLARLDGLTQVANRRHFDKYLKQEWLRLAREQNPLSLILCDVDYFKLYNDTYGHPAGDACLVEIAQAIRRAVKRPTDLVARYGGEEFVVLLPNTDSNGAIQVVQFIQKKVRQLNLPHIASPIGQYVTLSFGIATIFPSHNRSVQALINAADKALYEAKNNGRNCYQSIGIDF